jgi:hypothetical protein
MHTSAITRAAARFDLILVQNDLGAGIQMMNKVFGTQLTSLPDRVNEAKSTRQIDTSNPQVRAILLKRLTVDSWLWRHALAWNKVNHSKYLFEPIPQIVEK